MRACPRWRSPCTSLLKAVAATLARSIRRSDVLGRVGGEEFSIFLPDTTTGAATALAEKLRGAIAGLSIVVDGRPIAVTASIGVACARPGEVDMATLQHRADQAMHLAKAAGRNRETGGTSSSAHRTDTMAELPCSLCASICLPPLKT